MYILLCLLARRQAHLGVVQRPQDVKARFAGHDSQAILNGISSPCSKGATASRIINTLASG